MQRSTREGFGLTVSEAMWKSQPVVATHVGHLQSYREVAGTQATTETAA